MLPFVQEARREMAETSPEGARGYLNCASCLSAVAPAARALWNCGHLPRLPLNVGQYPLPLAAERPASDTCPGYTTSLPQVHETARAYGWLERGQIREFCGGEQPTDAMIDCLDILGGSVGESLAAAQRARAEEMRRNRG